MINDFVFRRKEGVVEVHLRQTSETEGFYQQLMEHFSKDPTNDDRLMTILSNTNNGQLRGKFNDFENVKSQEQK